MDLVAQTLISGLLVGGCYALMATGLNLVWGVMEIINFAHGAFLVLGMYITYWNFVLWGINPYISLPIVMALLFLLGWALQGLILNPIMREERWASATLLITLGTSIFLLNLALLVWGPTPRAISYTLSEARIELGAVIIRAPQLIGFGISILFLLLLGCFLKMTKLGRAIRATAQNSEGARLMGVNVPVIYKLTFGIGAAGSAAAGAVLITFLQVTPHIGLGMVILAFVICVLGTMGNYIGAFVGGLIIGVVEAFAAVLTLPSIKSMWVYIIFLIVLLVKPEGIFGSRK
jgi:branched-chain amino acid transport system permease protein